MSLTFSLFHRPGSVLVLDDEPEYLDMLGMVLPTHWLVELFSRPAAFARRMADEPARWEADAAVQLQMIERWRQGQPLIPQVLRYWAEHPQRHQLAKTCVIDYAMPGTNGLQLLETLIDWPGSRMMLTGQADEQLAVRAFNQGLIHQFVPKQAHDITRLLVGALRKLGQAAHPRVNAMWRATLRPAQQSILQIPAVAQALQAFTEKHWVEYAVLDQPFGLLGVDAEGRCHWLQLEPVASLGDLAELVGSAGLGTEVVRSVASGQRLAAIELHQQLGLRGSVRTAPTLPMGDDDTLTAALFSLDNDDLPAPIYPYRHFLASQGNRAIHDD
jgi:CheY-like chemotaxis protein